MKFLTLDEFLARLDARTDAQATVTRNEFKAAMERSPFGTICATCQYFQPARGYSRLDNTFGDCRRRSPSVQKAVALTTAWPMISPFEWCGEYLQVVRLTKDA